MPEREAIAHNLTKFRKLQKISQMEFAAECEISVEILSLPERQKTDPRLRTLQKIAANIGCKPKDLFDEQDWSDFQ